MPVFPSGGGGGGSLNPAWLANELYVSPGGSNSNSGKAGSPKKNIYNGLEALIDAGGGTLYADSNCAVGGPVNGQGIRLRLDQSFTFNAPGFLLLTAPVRIVGTGKNSGTGPFTNAPVSNYTGGGTRFDPALWILGQGQASPFAMANMQSADILAGARIAVDYDRNLDGSLRELSILNADHSGTSTTFTIDMTTVPELTATLAKRISNVTTLTIPNPGYPYQPWRVGQPLRVASSNPDFSSGQKVVTACSNNGNEGDNLLWTISYAETDADVAEEPAAGIAVKSHNCSPGELLDLITVGFGFYGVQYYVTSATDDTITVQDLQTGGSRNEDDIGTLVHQERHYGHTNMLQFSNVSFGIYNGVLPDQVYPFHGWDIGSNLANPIFMEGCWASGNTGTNIPVMEDRLCAAIYSYGGGGGTAVVMNRCNGNSNKVYVESGTNGLSYLDARDCLWEAPSTEWTEPQFRVDGNTFTRVFIDNCIQVDGDTSAANVEINGCTYTGAIVRRSGQVVGQVQGGDLWQTPNNWGAGTDFKNPWVGQFGSGMQPQIWADGRMVGKHPAAVRLGGPVAARFKNVIFPAASWTKPAGWTVTPGGGEPSPFGDASDLVETDSNGLVTVKTLGTDGATWEAGGRFVFCGWVNADADTALGPVFASALSGSFSQLDIATGYTGRGWQFVSGYAVVGSTSSNPSYSIALGFYGGNTISLYGLTAFYVPADIDDNDFCEFAGTLHHQPRYLPAGMRGTMDGQKFIADGGMGIDADITKVVGAGSGELTLTGTGTIYEPVYDNDGTTIIGWRALLQATVNP